MSFILYNKTVSLKFPGICQSAKAWFCLCDETTQGINTVLLSVHNNAGAYFMVLSVLLVREK